MSASILVGAVLTFAASDGSQLQLTVELSSSATVAVEWGATTRTSSASGLRHRFTGLPAPAESSVSYRVHIAGETPHAFVARPLRAPGPLRIALLGDSRGGDAVYQKLVANLVRTEPSVVINTGDMVQTAFDQEGWKRFLRLSLPLSSSAPMIYVVGNHELWGTRRSRSEQAIDALGSALGYLPPPDDARATKARASRAAFHVQLDRVLLVSLNSNRSLGRDSAQARFLDAVLADRPATMPTLVALHHGPISSGQHGGHPHGQDLMAQLERHGVLGVLSGHDHFYERLVRNGVTYLVSGGAGAPLYSVGRAQDGSVVAKSVHHAVVLDVEAERIRFTAYDVDGVEIDHGILGDPRPPEPVAVTATEEESAFPVVPLLIGGMVLLLLVALGARKRNP